MMPAINQDDVALDLAFLLACVACFARLLVTVVCLGGRRGAGGDRFIQKSNLNTLKTNVTTVIDRGHKGIWL